MRARIDLVIGTRPNIIKAAPLFAELLASKWCEPRLVFLMQHSDAELAHSPLRDLGVDPAHPVYVSLAEQGTGSRLGEMIQCYLDCIAQRRPKLVVVFGDVDTTLAASYAAKRSMIPVAHVEAGLRSGDRSMPEELNRLMVDAIADIHFATSEDAVRTLVGQEGHAPAHVHHVGNLMIDSLFSMESKDGEASACESMGVSSRGFALATFHRPSNVDDPRALEELLEALRECASLIPIVFPVHPRTRNAIERHGLSGALASIEGVKAIRPLSYAGFVALLRNARVVLTDSGGLQEETACLGVPCLTVRDNTERPVTISMGDNRLVSRRGTPAALRDVLARPLPAAAAIPLWDGRTASRIAGLLEAWWHARSPG